MPSTPIPTNDRKIKPQDEKRARENGHNHLLVNGYCAGNEGNHLKSRLGHKKSIVRSVLFPDMNLECGTETVQLTILVSFL